MKLKLSILLFIIVFLVILMCSYFFGNVISLIAARGYYIPEQSSVFTFRVTVDNEGSGEYWFYGEDNVHFYEAMSGQKLVFPKNKVKECMGFNPIDYQTWCIDYLIGNPINKINEQKIQQ